MTKRKKRKFAKRGRTCWLEALESRHLLTAGFDPAPAVVAEALIPVCTDPASTFTPGPVLPGATHPLSSLPLRSSYPSASAKLFLDFDGAPAQTWGYYNASATPAFDQDDDPTTFSDGELASIQTIWAEVAEAFSPFNVDVTTIDSGNRHDLQTAVVVIGGDGSWVGSGFAGLAHLGGFYNSAPNDVYVFSKNLCGNATSTARAAAHESGHNFGLNHQSVYDAQGLLQYEYNMGDAQKAPLMGSAYTAVRATWHNGPNPYGATNYQDDLALMTDGRNGWGFRADDGGNTPVTGTPLTVSGYTLSGGGIMGQLSDQDVFLLTTPGGDLHLQGNPAANGPMLDLQLALYNNADQLIASASTSSLGETITATLPAGLYYVVVASQGAYGDLGQYTLSGTLLPPATLAPPSNVRATAASTTVVDLAWLDNSNGEDGFRIERSDDGGISWTTLTATIAGTTYQDIGRAAGATYQYRVYAVAGTTVSDYSNTAGVAMLPQAPSNLTATAASTTVVNLAWQDNCTWDSGFKVQQSTNGGTTWTTLTSSAITATTYKKTRLTAGTTYWYRVFAVSGTTVSADSNVAQVTTLPAAPGGLKATAMSFSQIKLTWSNVAGETAYRIERSLTGTSGWTQDGTVAADTLLYYSRNLAPATKYYYRVFAVNASGSSASSSVASGTTRAPPPAAPSNLRATSIGTKSVSLAWHDNATNERGFKIEQSTNGTTWTQLGTTSANVTTYTYSRLSANTTYYYRVRAYNSVDASDYSNVITIKTLA